MNGLPYYKRYPQDFINGTAGLPGELKGAYSVLIDLMMLMGERGLPDDPGYVAGQLGYSVRKWNSLRAQLIDLGKIYVENGIISNSRADKEKIIQRSYRDTKAENGRGHNKNNDLEKRPRTLNNISESDTDTGTKVPERAAPPDLKAIVFGEGVKHLVKSGTPDRQARAILGKWCKAHGEAAVIDAIGRSQRAGAIEPVSFIEGVFRTGRTAPRRDGVEDAGAFGQIREVG